MTPLTLAAVAVATLVTSFISGILGMAGGMILMGVLIVLLPLPAAMMLHGVTQLAANGYRAWMLRHAIDRRVFREYAAGAVAALGAFAMVQVVASKPVALLMLGLLPFVSLVLPTRWRLDVERRGHPALCGVVCMGLSLTAGIAGPVLDVFFVRSALTRHSVIATKAATQSLTHLFKALYFGAILGGGAQGIAPWAFALVIALAFAGTNASRVVLDRMDDASFRAWTRRVVLGVGAVYLASGAVMLAR